MIDPLAAYAYTPYCGAPPTPGGLALRWNLDPVVLLTLGSALAVYAALTEPKLWGRGDCPSWQRACFYGGWAASAIALVSPLCALSVALFSARAGQHLILTMIAAPLIALGRPWSVLWSGLVDSRATPRDWVRIPGGELAAAVVFAALLWLWHSPGPYEAAFRSAQTGWLMHLSLLGSSVWLWAALYAAPAERPRGFLSAASVTTVQMGFLSAAVAFAGHPLYAPHALTTAAWGLTPMQDQHLGGLLLGVPPVVAALTAALAALAVAVVRAQVRGARTAPA